MAEQVKHKDEIEKLVYNHDVQELARRCRAAISDERVRSVERTRLNEKNDRLNEKNERLNEALELANKKIAELEESVLGPQRTPEQPVFVWKRGRPAQPGLYWHRFLDEESEMLVSVESVWLSLEQIEPHNVYKLRTGYGLLEDRDEAEEWAGPLVQPSDWSPENAAQQREWAAELSANAEAARLSLDRLNDVLARDPRVPTSEGVVVRDAVLEQVPGDQ